MTWLLNKEQLRLAYRIKGANTYAECLLVAYSVEKLVYVMSGFATLILIRGFCSG